MTWRRDEISFIETFPMSTGYTVFRPLQFQLMNLNVSLCREVEKPPDFIFERGYFRDRSLGRSLGQLCQAGCCCQSVINSEWPIALVQTLLALACGIGV